MNNNPDPHWAEIPDDELAKIGKTRWAFYPSDGGPPVIRETVSPPAGCVPRLWVSKEEAQRMYGLL